MSLPPTRATLTTKHALFGYVHRAYNNGRASERNPVLNFCDIQGIKCVVVAYTEEGGAAVDVAAQ
jgi:hypothetical protein